MPATRELHLVELVDEAGAAIGSTTVTAAHTAPGQLHRAFSVLLFDPSGRTLLQQRSSAKTRFPLRWANSCCGHPTPGTPVVEAAALRLAEELGVTGVALTDVGVYTYRAADEATGRVEHEYDHVVVGHVSPDLIVLPDPDEVAETRWVPAASLDPTGPEYAPWLSGVLPIALSITQGSDDLH
ncbi:MAG TPA: isopentenyl-diphosphate Delta-isomerase [Micromonosporaceae bacterium]|jgi:isopentenyl-diphosphate delta-isomerase